MKIDNSYLGHNFKEFTTYYVEDDYKCDKCGVEINVEPDSNDRLYYNILSKTGEYLTVPLEITCKDNIIKNIIE